MCRRPRIAGALALLWLWSPATALAEEATISAAEFMTNNVWMMICTALVFIMHLGFASLESGLSRSKNTVNILFKNVFVPLVALLTHYAFGFSLMYPGEFDGVLGFAGFGLTPPDNGMTAAYAASHGYTYWTDFLFQAMFAATCATIGTARISAGEAALQPPSQPTPWRQWLLWAVLVLGAGLVAVFALGLLRSHGKPP